MAFPYAWPPVQVANRIASEDKSQAQLELSRGIGSIGPCEERRRHGANVILKINVIQNVENIHCALD